MPPLATTLTDEKALAMLREWITSMKPEEVEAPRAEEAEKTEKAEVPKVETPQADTRPANLPTSRPAHSVRVRPATPKRRRDEDYSAVEPGAAATGSARARLAFGDRSFNRSRTSSARRRSRVSSRPMAYQ